ncbi:DUF4124 domain-containing protein [Shewanella sp. NIFS-20-20]|uniref:DUF4124 domain-containing protein n=1 Tax=Shewanella sp. NIFS-20-20 TaxID=2853806 RepID=UPI001C493054|nr:DUF4124 domain-containing protein [Shewanella sp. NIFS-20-20]MBV7315963.1 DUF4124 domain-containing protein [Shewanella sp. NIFS-20-20]
MPTLYRHCQCSLLLLVCCFSSTLIAAEVIYTWIDNDGLVHYSQQAPSDDIQFTKIYNDDIEPAKSGFIAPKQKQLSRQDQQAITEAQALLIKNKDANQARALCESAQHKQQLLTSYSRLTVADPATGEQVELSDTQRKADLAVQQERIRLYCTK